MAATYDPKLSVDGPPIHAIIIAGRIVSTCESSREDDRAAEAWVRTLPEFRRRGYARQGVSAWAYDRMRRGKVAFYSHRPDNEASAGLARSLDLSEVMTVVG